MTLTSIGVVGVVITVLVGIVAKLRSGRVSGEIAAAKQEYKDTVDRIKTLHGNEEHRAELLGGVKDDKGK